MSATIPVILSVIISAVVLLVAAAIQVLVALAFAKCAESKGYRKWMYFWVCFFFGTIGYIIVAALPDRVLNENLSELMKQTAKV